MKQDRPLVIFDLEATGVSPLEDRIVDIALIRRQPGGGEEVFSSLVNPGLPIPKDAVAVHHITDEMVKDAPSLKELAPKILQFLEGADLGGFNVLKYDIPLLANELKRAGFELPLEGRRVVDAFSIYQKKEPRNLAAAYQLYCGKAIANAHRAEADARATLEILDAQLSHYPDLPQEMGALSAFCAPRDAVDREGKFVWRNGEVVFGFGGKHRGKTLREVAKADRSYINWMIDKGSFSAEVVKLCQAALSGELPVRKE
ncbi:MAG: 3'-5' exonuclease [Elusimicrobia bacterium]|nr:3'-5' exonuclease [Elusimicrobiota bacterium]